MEIKINYHSDFNDDKGCNECSHGHGCVDCYKEEYFIESDMCLDYIEKYDNCYGMIPCNICKEITKKFGFLEEKCFNCEYEYSCINEGVCEDEI